MPWVKVDIEPKVYEALEVISKAFDIPIEQLVAQGARAEAEGFLSNPQQYTDELAEKTAEKVKKILEV